MAEGSTNCPAIGPTVIPAKAARKRESSCIKGLGIPGQNAWRPVSFILSGTVVSLAKRSGLMIWAKVG